MIARSQLSDFSHMHTTKIAKVQINLINFVICTVDTSESSITETLQAMQIAGCSVNSW